MSKTQTRHHVIEGLRGSEQHHPLKNEPGEKGDPDHNKPESEGGDDKKSTTD
ncbi:hypothetical protein CLV78_10767 [Aliiruegeria haliotis]|uniref:Uncharacterized protein n=1 Tax=Aliiruegeria haliotis TaxID=1280846 RepID=A0A2T0RM04_9RHOB|nr:hypothetical protein [Aliiruegeria haliotis]PRY22143.1 hypothetical protein CLV78_10767 [Aliiruegeria haliotis]